MASSENLEIYEVRVGERAQSEANRLLRKKYFKSLPNQILNILDEFEKGNFVGDNILTYEKPTRIEVYKLRLPNLDVKVGKSNGFRIIYAIAVERKIVVILTIYYKKEIDTLPDSEIRRLVNRFIADYLPEIKGTENLEDKG